MAVANPEPHKQNDNKEKMMTRSMKLCIFAVFAGFFLSSCGGDDTTEVSSADSTTTAPDAMAMPTGHDHDELIDVGVADAPRIEITATADPISGANLEVRLENFTIAPEHASTEHVLGEGHMHLYVDGERVGRLYNTWAHVPLTAGDHTIAVHVSGNDHRSYAIDGEIIQATANVTAVESEHHHDDGFVVLEGEPPTVTIQTFDDPMSGVNLEVTLDHFVMAPERASTEYVPGEGHLHLYIDGVRVGRLYGRWAHIDGLVDGEHVIEVEVGANDHRPYSIDGLEPLRAAATVVTDDGFQPAEGDDMDDAHMDDDHMEDEMGSSGAHEVAIDVANGQVVGGVARIEIGVGDAIALTVTSDEADEVHVHAYDLIADVASGHPATIEFTAGIPGVFEVELEGSGTLLANIVVS